MESELLDLLACPKCKGPLVYDGSVPTLTCEACRLRYSFDGEIPILLIDEAETF